MGHPVLIEVGKDGSREYVNPDQIERIIYCDIVTFKPDANGEQSVEKGIKVCFASGEVRTYSKAAAANVMALIDSGLEFTFRGLIPQKVS